MLFTQKGVILYLIDNKLCIGGDGEREHDSTFKFFIIG